MSQSSPRHSVSVAAAIVNDDGQVLAVRRRDNGHWEPPGGVLELDETIQEGLVREVKEETCLQVEPEALTGVYKNMRRGDCRPRLPVPYRLGCASRNRRGRGVSLDGCG